jgi:triosephosphate isomerase (TIM)
MRRPIIAANWKMYLGQEKDALALSRRILHALNQIENCDIVICPPFTAIPALAVSVKPLRVSLGAQNMHWEDAGAYTGEISPQMLAGLCDYVILGHSERRATGSCFEDDAAIAKKIRAALAHKLIPILCVGEDAAQRESGETEVWIAQQVAAALEGLSAEQISGCVIAYEPIWAIGTGKTSSPSEANRVIGLVIRGVIANGWGETAAQSIRIQYGGSVKPENIAAFMAMPEIDGALVGGASLSEQFIELAQMGPGIDSVGSTE